ncbi:MAG: Ig-like domain-containing protein [Deltaproteobacteria bacterium]|nr:Ig-like domain-containing protein [Deltaproteobacteria bacterium]
MKASSGIIFESCSTSHPSRIREALLVLALAWTAACSPKIAEIQIKGPPSSVSSSRLAPEATAVLGSLFPVFEKPGETLQLRVSAFNRDGAYLGSTPVEWKSSDLSVATVSADGLVTVQSSGTFIVSATTTDLEPTLSASLSLRAVIVGSVRIAGQDAELGGKASLQRGSDGAHTNRLKADRARTQPLELALGETVSLRAEVLNDRDEVIEDAKVRWRSTGYAVSVTPEGEVEGRAIGNTQLVAEAKGQTARIDVRVVDWRPKGRASRSRAL